MCLLVSHTCLPQSVSITPLSSPSEQGSVLCSAGGCVVAKVCVDFCCSAAGSIVLLLPLSFPCLSLCLYAFIFVYIVWEQWNIYRQLCYKERKKQNNISPRASVSFITPGKPSTLLFFFSPDHFTQLCQHFYDDLSEVLIFALIFTPCTFLSWSSIPTVLSCLSPVAVVLYWEGGRDGWRGVQRPK